MTSSPTGPSRRTAAWVLNAPDSPATLAFTSEAVVGDKVTLTLPAVPIDADTQRVVLVDAAGQVFDVSLDHPSAVVGVEEGLGGESLATILLTDAPARRLPNGPNAEGIRAYYSLASAQQILEDATAAYAMTRDHVRVRQQFGAPLLSIPAVAANLARVRVALLQVEAAVTRAQSIRELEADSATYDAAVIARITAARAGTEIARLTHQLHGAKGVRADFPLQQYTRRIWTNRDSQIPVISQVRQLGERVLRNGETALWEHVTDPA